MYLRRQVLLDCCPTCKRPLQCQIPNIDLLQMRVGDEKITPAEVTLMTLGTRRLGYPVSKADMVRELWERDANGGALDTSRHIRVMISLLNRKLEKIGYKWINVRSYGYKLIKLPDEVGMKGDTQDVTNGSKPTSTNSAAS